MDTIIDVINYTAPSTEVCLIQGRNKTIVITDLYEGIPQTLILNIIAWLILILLFTILRQQAWDYGRLALVNNCYADNKRWTQLFYAHGNELMDSGGITNHDTRSIISNNSSSGGNTGGGGGSSIGMGHRISNHRGSGDNSTAAGDGYNNRGGDVSASIDRGLFSWLWVTIKLKKENILSHSGPDAVHYLSFQQHLMVVMAIITFISIVIILPVNFQGTLIPGVNSFGHTTISNLAPDSTLLWIHVIVAIIYVPLVVLIMRRSSGRNAFKTAPTRTIMATNISRSDCNKATIRNYLQELFPDRQFEDIELAYNITKLTELVNEYERVISARIYCEMHRNRDKIYATTNCWTCKTIDALEYYQEKEQQLQGEVARLRASSLNSPLGIAFITVSSMEAAQDIIMHFRPGTYREWTLTYAPAPSDLFWENLSVGASRWYVKWVIVNFCLFLFLFFLTTPVYIVNMLGVISQQVGKVSPLVSEFLPTLMLWTLAALMPVIVSFSDKWLSHWTRSKQNYSIMTKSFGYLLFMILILPSLGLTSAQALLEWTFHYDDNEKYRWDCIFLPDKGAFFVNYVITAAFIGTALELLRFPDLIVYIWMLCTAKSRAETTHVRKSILIEFPFGIHYAWTIMVFTMSTVYSIACPLIMPFAMVYIILKHFGDRHNLYFAYGPSNMISQGGGKIHSTAVTMTKVSTVLLLIILAALATVRKGGIDPRAIVLLLSLFVTLTLFTFMSPIKKCTTKRPSICELHGPAPIYVADVLLNRRVFQSTSENGGGTNNNNNNNPISHLGYGSDTPTSAAVDLEAYITEDVPIRNVFT